MPDPTPGSLVMPMSDGVRIGPDESGLVDRDQVRLLVWIDQDEAAVAGPSVGDRAWVVRAIRALSRQWEPQTEQVRLPIPPPVGVEYLDCTRKELAVIVYNSHHVVVERDEIFPGSGLASHYIDVAGYRRHETDWAKDRLDDLAYSIEQEEGYLYEL